MIIVILDFKDEQLCDNLNHVFSGLLPHSQYNPDTFSRLYPALLSALATKDVRGLHYVFYTVFDKYFSLQKAVGAAEFKVSITRERFITALENNLPDLVLEPQVQVKELMNEEGKSGDITIPTVQSEAMGVIYEKAMALYDTCFEFEQTYEDAMAYIVNLRDAIKANIIETGLQMQRAIISVGLRYGKHTYRGTSGWVSFSQQLVREVSEMDLNTSEDLVCNNLDILPDVDCNVVEISEALAKYGIPQLDDVTPILRHRMVVFVAKENTGKTRIMTHLIANLIRNNIKPYLACGETKPQKMFMQIVSSYIFQEYGMHFSPSDLTGDEFEDLSDEDKQIVQTAKARVSCSGLIISDRLEYDNVQAVFTEAYTMGCEAFFIDHTQSLRGRKGRKISDLVTNLALDCREFKNNYPVYIGIASHPSTNLKDILQKEQAKDIHQSPTAQSSTLSQEADEVFILTDTDYLKKQNLLQWIVNKRRDAPIPQSFYIKKLFHVSSYIYDPNVQSGENMDAQELEGLISDIGSGDLDFVDPDGDDMRVDF